MALTALMAAKFSISSNIKNSISRTWGRHEFLIDRQTKHQRQWQWQRHFSKKIVHWWTADHWLLQWILLQKQRQWHKEKRMEKNSCTGNFDTTFWIKTFFKFSHRFLSLVKLFTCSILVPKFVLFTSFKTYQSLFSLLISRDSKRL